MKYSDNKHELKEYLAKKIIELHQRKQLLITTFKDTFLCSFDPEPLSQSDISITKCQSEEADQNLIRHTLHIIENYIHFKRIVVRTIDTDFLILLISYIGQLSEIRPDIKQILGKVKLDITIFSARQLISDENGVNRGGVRVIVVQAIIISVISSL